MGSGKRWSRSPVIGGDEGRIWWDGTGTAELSRDISTTELATISQHHPSVSIAASNPFSSTIPNSSSVLIHVVSTRSSHKVDLRPRRRL